MNDTIDELQEPEIEKIKKYVKLSKKELIKILKEQQKNMDAEVAHLTADRILCAFLIKIGHEDIVKEWIKVYKWYA